MQILRYAMMGSRLRGNDTVGCENDIAVSFSITNYARAFQIIILDYNAQMAIRSSFIFSKKAQEYLLYFEHFFEKIRLEMMVR